MKLKYYKLKITAERDCTSKFRYRKTAQLLIFHYQPNTIFGHACRRNICPELIKSCGVWSYRHFRVLYKPTALEITQNHTVRNI